MSLENNVHAMTMEAINQHRADEILSSVPAEHRDHVQNTPFSLMVRNLAKAPEQILETLTDGRLNTLMESTGYIAGACDALDKIKKVCIYNKDLPGVRQNAEGPFSVADLSTSQVHLLHMTVGAVGESGELAEALGKHLAGEPLDKENVREEIGDILFYLQGIIGELGMSLDEVLLANKAKLLGNRYAAGYSDKAAQERADKAEGQ